VEAEEDGAAEAMRLQLLQTRVERQQLANKDDKENKVSPGLIRPIPHITRAAFRELLQTDSNLTRLFIQQGPIIVTDPVVGPDEWDPTHSACRDGRVTFGHQVLHFLRQLTRKASPEQLRRLDLIAQANHNKTFAGLLETLGGTSSVPEFQAYVAGRSSPAFDQVVLGGPSYPNLEKEIERYVRMPLSAHDVPLTTLCPERLGQWTPASLLEYESGFKASSARVFWGPRGSQPYPMHTNEDVASGPIMKFVSHGRQEVAIFNRTEAGKLMPLLKSDAQDPHPTAVFRVDALSPPEEAAHFGDFAHARGWRDELKAGEVLVFMGRFLHQFQNPVQSFSLIFLT
jgi:hypothetical protein